MVKSWRKRNVEEPTSGGVKRPGHPVYMWTVLEEARRARGMLRSFLLVYHVCHKGAVPGCIITARARHTARFIREQRKDAFGLRVRENSRVRTSLSLI